MTEQLQLNLFSLSGWIVILFLNIFSYLVCELNPCIAKSVKVMVFFASSTLPCTLETSSSACRIYLKLF